MWYIAFSLGLFGSLHCVGMCGPLAIAFSSDSKNSYIQNVISGISYNIGRTVTYAFLGLLFGSIGSFLFIADVQKVVSIGLGIALILSFLFSIDIDKKINQNTFVSKLYHKIKKLIANMMQRSEAYHPFQLGMANGLLPCGLVYLGLAGALATGSVIGGMYFMGLFGLGTIPMLLALTTGYGLFPLKTRLRFRAILPYVTLAFGMFLIYRGIIVSTPTELNFWEAVNNPIMCH